MSSREAQGEYDKAVRLTDQGFHTEALSAYRKAIGLDKNDPRFHVALGVCLMKMQRWDEAIKSLITGINLRPAYAEADTRVFLAEAYIAVGEKTKAVEQLKRILTMPPVYPSNDKPMQEAKRLLGEMGLG